MKSTLDLSAITADARAALEKAGFTRRGFLQAAGALNRRLQHGRSAKGSRAGHDAH